MKDENKSATKADVKQIVKAELKKGLKDVVRKKDIEDVVRKKDIEKYAEKDWVEKWTDRAEDIYATKDWMIENMYTKKDHEKTLTILDAIVQQLNDISLDLKLANSRIDRTEDTGDNHEKRIVKLERKVLI